MATKVATVLTLALAVGWLANAGNSTVQFGYWDGAAWVSTFEFRIGERLQPSDRVWVRVYDPDLAASPWVRIHNPSTGDWVEHRLDTAIAGGFRSAASISLIPATGTPSVTDNRLEVNPGDTLYVYYSDPGDATDSSQATATAVLGKVHLYEGQPQPGYRNLVGTFSGLGAINAALTRAGHVAAETLPAMNRPWIVVTPGDYRPVAGTPLNIVVTANLGAVPPPVVVESQVPGAARILNADANAPVIIGQNDVTLRGFTIELDIAAAGAAGAHGVYIAPPAGGRQGIVIENNTIRKIHGTTDRDAIHFSGGNPVTGIIIRGNRIEGTFGTTRTRDGIRFESTPVTNVLIEWNDIVECRDHGVHFANAGPTLQDVRILNNSVVNCDADRDGAGSGVQLNAGSTVRALRIAGNLFQGNEHGVNLQLAAGGSVRDLLVEGNKFLNQRRIADGNTADANLQAGLRVVAAGALTPANFEVRNNTFLGNEAGILFPSNANVRGVVITNNVVQDNDIGIWVRHQDNVIMGNDIVGNVLWGLHALNIGGDPRNMVNARDNWWGHSSGPKHLTRNPAGQGNPVTDHVDFVPFRQGSAVPQGIIELRDAAIPLEAAGTFDIAFTGGNLAELQVGPVSVVTFSDASKIDVTGVTGVSPYQVLAWNYVEAGGTGRLTFTVNLIPGQNPKAGVIARVTVKGTGTAGDTVQMNLSPVPVDKCVDKNANAITHAVYNGTLTLSAAAPPAQAKGDVNGDRKVDITDAKWAAEAAIGLRTLSAAQFAAADVAPPLGKVDITDARWIAEAAVELRTLALPMPSTTYAGGAATVRMDAGVLEVNGAQVSDVQGRILYNPSAVTITGLSGVNGFEVLAWRDDPAARVVWFAAIRLNGGAAGGILQVRSRGDATALSVGLDVLRGPDGTDVPFGVAAAPALLSVRNTPNPVTDVHTTYFHVQATVAVIAIRVSLFDLAGRLVWDSGWAQNGLAWHLDDLRGRTVANGVYLYQVQVKLQGLETVIASGLQKLAVYR